MAVVADPVVTPPRPDQTVAKKILRVIAKLPVHLFLLFVAVLWLVPTIGLAVTSLMSAQDYSQFGWWKVISHPHIATWANYSNLFHNTSIPSSLRTTAEITIGGTVLPIVIGAMAGYAFAWLEFPGRDWIFIGVIALLVVPIQMALIPLFTIYNKVSLYDTVLGLILFHTAFGLPFAIFLLRNFFIGIPKDILESARIDGASACRRSPRSRSSSSCGRGTTCWSPSRWRATRSRSPSRSSRTCVSSARTSTSSRRPRSSRS
jgi:alpha-glucoside transport system permease protein